MEVDPLTITSPGDDYDFIKTEKPEEEISFVVPGLMGTSSEISDSEDHPLSHYAEPPPTPEVVREILYLIQIFDSVT